MRELKWIYLSFAILQCEHSPTSAGHAGHVEGVPVEAVACVTFLYPNTATVLTAIQDPTFLSL